MAAPKGHKRYGGRVAGKPNKKTQTIIEQCEAKNIDVLDLMLVFVTTPCEPALRLQALKELMRYIYPQRKAIEHSGDVDNKIEIIITDYTKKIDK